MIRSIIFDFDGLIIDTELPDFLSWAETFEAHGCSLPLSTWAPYIGRPSGSFDPYAHLEEQLGRPIDRDAIRASRRRRYLELVEAQPILPGVAEYIADAGRLGLRLAVASSSSRQWVSGHLSRLGLSEHFDCIRCADDVQQAKPSPDVYNSVLDALHVEPRAALALEDSPNGVAAAKRAGLFCVAVPNSLTRQLPLDEADLRLESLADLSLERLIKTAQEAHTRAAT